MRISDVSSDLCSSDLGAEPNRLALQAIADDLFEARKRAAADEQDVGRVDLKEFLLRMLAAALRRNRGNRALHHLEQRLLDALARYIARDRGIFGLAADLVDLVDIDDPALCPLDVVIRRLEQDRKRTRLNTRH